MLRGVAVVLLGALLAGPAAAQTDDRVANDILTLYRAEAIVAAFRETCAEATGGSDDVAAAFDAWDQRAFHWRADALIVQDQRPPIPAYALRAADEAGRADFRKDLPQHPDLAAYCRQARQGLDAGTFDFANWHPAEVERLRRARAGEMPVLDVDGSDEVRQAMEIKGVFYLHEALFGQCGTLHPPAARYAEALAEWQARNGYTGGLADTVLKNWGALAPQRFEKARADAAAEAERMLANGHAPALCSELRDAAMAGRRDFDVVNPAAFETVRRNAEVVP